MLKKSLVSIIIVNWNGKKWLEKCLSSLQSQTYKYFEIIFVDNSSTDDSIEYIRSNFPEVKIVVSSENLGFAGGNNLGLQHAQGEYVYLLNTDTESSETSIEELVDYMQSEADIAIAQPRLVLLGDKTRYDAVVSYWTYTTMLYYDGAYSEVSNEKYSQQIESYTIKGAACIIRKSVIDQIGLFDDSYWCYFEETDFCHRAIVAGYRVMYANTAPVYHAGGGASLQFENSFVQFHNFKNKLRTYLKNFQISTLLYVLPVHILLCFFLSFFWLIKDRKKSIAVLQSIWWNIKNIKSTLEKREKVQKIRKVKDSVYLKRITKNPPLEYYYYLLIDLKKYAKLR